MPAALDVDWESVKTLAAAIGLKPAADRLGLSYEAVRQRSCREGWLTNLPRSQSLPPTVLKPVTLVTSPAQALKDELSRLSSDSRLGMARGLAKAALEVEQMPGNEVLAQASNIKQTVQSLDVIHGWKEASPVAKVALTITGGAVASAPAGDAAPAIEAEWADIPGEAVPDETDLDSF